MKYQIDRGAKDAAYLQLYRQLRQDIIDGLLPEGTKLPSKRQLAAELGLSLITVEHALSLLVDEGYAVSRERSGFYAAAYGGTAPPAPKARLEDMSLPDDMPEAFPFSALARIMRRVLSDYGEKILTRSPKCGLGELRAAIADYLARSRGIRVHPEQIVVGPGTEYFYAMLVQLLGRERVYAHENPCFDTIRRVYALGGARCEALAMGADGIEPTALTESHASVLHVTPYQSYPSGVSASAARRRDYAAWARTRAGFIIEDDYGAELAVSTRQVETIFSLAPECVVYLNSFSKTLAPSMRMAYMVLPEALLPLYEERLGFYSCAVPVYEQLVLAAFIRDGELERHVNRLRRREREFGFSF